MINFLLKNIPRDKIIFNSRIQSIDHERNLKINTLDNSWDADHLIISDGIFSKSKEMVLKSSNLVKYYNSVALRGTLKNLDINDISLFLGPKFHFVIYPVNQDNEYNFIAIIRDKNANKDDEIYRCTADVGWITGHSYIVYGPLSNGTTTLMFEGVPRASNLGAFWAVSYTHLTLPTKRIV